MKISLNDREVDVVQSFCDYGSPSIRKFAGA